MKKHILLATDLSDNCHVVAQRAKQIANVFGAQISIVHVFEYRPVFYSVGEFELPIDVDLLASMEKNARAALEQVGKKLGVPHERVYFEKDSIVHSVVELADKLGVDLIVIGSHGTHGPALLLGSVANTILHAAKCDVLAVRI